MDVFGCPKVQKLILILTDALGRLTKLEFSWLKYGTEAGKDMWWGSENLANTACKALVIPFK